MIKDRFYIPADNELIYQYCSPDAFLGIIKSRAVWLSAYYTLNDSMERTWGYSIFLRTLEQLRNQLDKEFVSITTNIILSAFKSTMIMISSYSLDADVLSQWRAYADNGRGFA